MTDDAKNATKQFSRRAMIVGMAATPIALLAQQPAPSPAAPTPRPTGPVPKAPERAPVLPLSPVRSRQNGLIGYSDRTGRVIVKPVFDAGGYFVDYLGRQLTITWIRIGKKFGFIGNDGKVRVAPTYDSLQGYSEGLAAVRVNGLYGYVDGTGEIVIDARYRSVEPFSGGFASVRIGNEIGWIDTKGEFYESSPRR